MRLQASDLAAVFEVYMLATALVALKSALDAGGPWYRETATLWVYATTFLGGLIVVGILVLAALVLTRPRGYEPPAAAAAAQAPNPSPPVVSAEAAGEEVEGLLASIEEAAEPGPPPDLAAETGRDPAAAASASALDVAIVHRMRVRRVVVLLLGPSVAAGVFAAISAALLPASEGLLQGWFTLNTFLVITLAWGWIALIPYAVASLFLALSEA